jgi:diadenylate cyclase
MGELISFLSTIRWQDVVDIVLNAYILFRLYVLFRGTNVIRVIAGIALLWIFQSLAGKLGLIVTSWAMQGIIAGAALIIIIVFRNEIRNVLQAKNLRVILWGFPQASVRTPLDSLIEGVYDLANNRRAPSSSFPARKISTRPFREGSTGRERYPEKCSCPFSGVAIPFMTVPLSWWAIG